MGFDRFGGAVSHQNCCLAKAEPWPTQLSCFLILADVAGAASLQACFLLLVSSILLLIEVLAAEDEVCAEVFLTHDGVDGKFFAGALE